MFKEVILVQDQGSALEILGCKCLYLKLGQRQTGSSISAPGCQMEALSRLLEVISGLI